MTVKQLIALGLALSSLGQQCAFARQKTPATLAWNELGKVVVDKRIATRLTDGKKIDGQVLAVRPDSLVIDINKTSDRKVYPKGQSAIPRESVTSVRLVRHRGPFKLVGGILGTVGGVFTAGTMTYYWYAAGALTGFILVLPAMAVTGYYLGKAADKRSTTIAIEPANQTPAGAAPDITTTSLAMSQFEEVLP